LKNKKQWGRRASGQAPLDFDYSLYASCMLLGPHYRGVDRMFFVGGRPRLASVSKAASQTPNCSSGRTNTEFQLPISIAGMSTCSWLHFTGHQSTALAMHGFDPMSDSIGNVHLQLIAYSGETALPWM